MSTHKQIEANHLSAKRDGLTGQVTTLPDGDRRAFEKLQAELIADLRPQTLLEHRLAAAIAWDTWRLDHLRTIETNLFALGVADSNLDIECDSPELNAALADAVTFITQAAPFARLSLLEQRLGRNLHRNIAALREMQAAGVRKAVFARTPLKVVAAS